MDHLDAHVKLLRILWDSAVRLSKGTVSFSDISFEAAMKITQQPQVFYMQPKLWTINVFHIFSYIFMYVHNCLSKPMKCESDETRINMDKPDADFWPTLLVLAWAWCVTLQVSNRNLKMPGAPSTSKRFLDDIVNQFRTCLFSLWHIRAVNPTTGLPTDSSWTKRQKSPRVEATWRQDEPRPEKAAGEFHVVPTIGPF